ncbi:chemotaxis protein [Alcaligenaceae bacterium SJ-26]|nr:chemotaxis protein [Alcaligenaceae bacterium SJ-26]
MERLGFRSKIILLMAVALAAVFVLAASALYQERNLIIEARHNQLVSAVQSAYSIAAHYQQQAATGAISQEEAQRAAREAIRVSRYGGEDGKTEYFYIWRPDIVSVMHPMKPEWEGKDMTGKVVDGTGQDIIRLIADAMRQSPDGRVMVDTMFERPGQTGLKPKQHYVMLLKDWNWMIGSGLYTDDIDQQIRHDLLMRLLGVLLVAVVVGGIGFMVVRAVLRQIGGDPALAIAAMERVAAGDLTVTVPASVPGSLLDSLMRMVQALRTLVGDVRSATESIALASSEIAHGTQDLAQRTEHTAADLQTTASSMEQITSTVRQTADSSTTAQQLAGAASQVAQRGGAVVNQVVETMHAIQDSSGRINDIIGVIDGIAFQTNILALNASVEAARAGEQGRGFAVVAGEVRNLAQRSASAAREIKTLIVSSNEQVQSGSALVEQAGDTMTEILHGVQRVTDIVGEIHAATLEQSQGIDQINAAVGSLDLSTHQNSALVEESSAAAESLREQAQALAHAVAFFRVSAEDSRRANVLALR